MCEWSECICRAYIYLICISKVGYVGTPAPEEIQTKADDVMQPPMEQEVN